MPINEERPFVAVKIAVHTVSDTRSPEDDKSGATLVARIEEAGHTIAARDIVKDDIDALREQVSSWVNRGDIDVVITTGGTGFTGHDVTPEALEPLFDKPMDGFSIAFHMLSHTKIGSSTIQSRATAVVHVHCHRVFDINVIAENTLVAVVAVESLLFEVELTSGFRCAEVDMERAVGSLITVDAASSPR